MGALVELISWYESEDRFDNAGEIPLKQDAKYSATPILASCGPEQAVDQRQNSDCSAVRQPRGNGSEFGPSCEYKVNHEDLGSYLYSLSCAHTQESDNSHKPLVGSYSVSIPLGGASYEKMHAYPAPRCHGHSGSCQYSWPPCCTRSFHNPHPNLCASVSSSKESP